MLIPKPGVAVLNATRLKRGGGTDRLRRDRVLHHGVELLVGSEEEEEERIQCCTVEVQERNTSCHFPDPAVTFLSFKCFHSFRPRHLSTSPTQRPVAPPAQILIPLSLLSLPVQPSFSLLPTLFLLCCYSKPPFDETNLSHWVVPLYLWSPPRASLSSSYNFTCQCIQTPLIHVIPCAACVWELSFRLSPFYLIQSCFTAFYSSHPILNIWHTDAHTWAAHLYSMDGNGHMQVVINNDLDTYFRVKEAVP